MLISNRWTLKGRSGKNSVWAASVCVERTVIAKTVSLLLKSIQSVVAILPQRSLCWPVESGDVVFVDRRQERLAHPLEDDAD